MKPSTVPTKEDFQLLRVIGRGSFGKVLLVRNKHDRRVYALKILKKATVVARNQVEHTINERKILEEIDFPFLCRLEFAFQTDDKLYLGMQFIAGGPLFFHLQQVEVFSFYYPVSSLLGGASAFLRGGGDSGHRISPQSPYHLSVATECVCHVAI
jgi:singapore isolate B (sub-type 7) whole genome shotgun sequence assembly, scaffold_14